MSRYTKRTEITKEQIEALRATRVKRGKDVEYFLSKKFDKEVKEQVKLNRQEVNKKRLDFISKRIGTTTEERNVVKKFFGEGTAKRGNKIVRTNVITSLSQTKRLAKIEKDIKSGTFKFENYLKNDERYKVNKKFLPENPTISKLIQSISRTEFYFENEADIKAYNEKYKDNKTSAKKSAEARRLKREWRKKKEEEQQALLSKLIEVI